MEEQDLDAEQQEEYPEEIQEYIDL